MRNSVLPHNGISNMIGMDIFLKEEKEAVTADRRIGRTRKKMTEVTYFIIMVTAAPAK